MSRGSSVGIATGWTARIRFPVGSKDFSLLYSVQNGSGAHPTSYPMSTRGSIPGVKRPGREPDHSTSAEVKNDGAMPPLPHMSLWHNA
jgi:hypothetical protein